MPDPTPTDPTRGIPAGLLTDLAFAQAHDQALTEMEIAADASGEPLPDRAAATHVAWVLRAVGASRVVELGAGRGALTWWLAGAVSGEDAEVHAITDGASRDRLEATLRRSGRFEPVTVHTTDHADAGASPEHLDVVTGHLDAIVVREVTPDLLAAWGDVGARLRPGGVLVVGEVLAAGPPTGTVGAVVREALEDPELWTSIVPIGTGWLVALRSRSEPTGRATDHLM